MSLQSIDEPLLRYAITYRFHLTELSISKSINKRNAKSITNSLLLCLIFNALRHVIYIIYSNNGKVAKYLFDVIQYAGGISVYNYIGVISGTLLTIRTIHLFNYSPDSHFLWFDVIKLLKYCNDDNYYKFEKYLDITKLMRKSKFMYRIINLILYAFYRCAFVVLLIFLFTKFENWQIVYYGIFSILIFAFYLYVICGVIFYTFFYFCIIVEFCKLRYANVNKLLQKMISNKQIIAQNSIFNDLIAEHNNVCQMINNYNAFWSKYYLALNYTIIPLNLVCLQQIFFENIEFLIWLCTTLFAITLIVLHISLNVMTAAVNKESTISYNYITKMVNNHSEWITIRQKLKVSTTEISERIIMFALVIVDTSVGKSKCQKYVDWLLVWHSLRNDA